MARTRTTGIAKLAGIGIVALGIVLGSSGSSSASPMKGWERGDLVSRPTAGAARVAVEVTPTVATPAVSTYEAGYLRPGFIELD